MNTVHTTASLSSSPSPSLSSSLVPSHSSTVTTNNESTNNSDTIRKILDKKELDRKKKEEQRKQGLSFQDEDIVVDAQGDLTHIKDLPISKISHETLKSFARKLKLKVAAGISKMQLVKELANYKVLEPQRDAMKGAVINSSIGTGNSLPSGLLHSDGTIIRVILTILDPDNRECYMGTGQQISRGELGANDKYVPNYSRLAVAYNADNDDYDDAGVSLSPHKDIYDIYGIYDETPSLFDVLDATKFAQVLKFIHKKYRVARNNNQKSGSHDDFENFINGCAWILFYHERMAEMGDHATLYYNLAYPVLPDSVFVTSDGMTEAPGGGQTSAGGTSRKKKGAVVDDNIERRQRDKTAAERNLSSRRLFDDTNELQKRKRRAQLMDEIMATEDLLHDMEMKLHDDVNPNDDFILRRVQSLKRKLAVLKEDEDILVSSLLSGNTDE